MDNLKKQHSPYMSEIKYEYIFDSITNINSIKIVTLSLWADTLFPVPTVVPSAQNVPNNYLLS